VKIAWSYISALPYISGHIAILNTGTTIPFCFEQYYDDDDDDDEEEEGDDD
jgi:hypothetical protein